MQGVFVNGQRSNTKAALKKAVSDKKSEVVLEATSLFGTEYDGLLDHAPEGQYYVVGPDPARNRKWYATIEVNRDGDGKRKVTVK